MTAANKIYDIELRPLSEELSFLTDRWGEPIDSDEADHARLEKAGVSVEDLEAAMVGMENIFQNEISFLVQPAGCTGKESLHLLVEFEFADEYQPQDVLSPELDAAGLAAWRAALTFHAPALLAVARGLESLPDTAESLRPIFDTAAFYGGAIVVLLPLPVSTDTFVAVHDLLFNNGLPWPPSNHAQLAAVGQIRWRHDPAQIPSAALPGPFLPLD